MMGINSISSNSNVGGVVPNTNSDEAQKTSTFAGKKIGLSDNRKTNTGETTNVQQNSLINSAESAKTTEVAKNDDIQETSKPMGMFGKFKIGPGNASNKGMKNKIGKDSAIDKNKSLANYIS